MSESWPPTTDDLRSDQELQDVGDELEEARLARCLDAAVAFVERVRGSSFDFTGDPDSDLPAPTSEIVLGTVRLAARWYVRRRSPDALVVNGELGTSRIPSFDADIERPLGIGRYARPVIA